jgi:hypothetical protein
MQAGTYNGRYFNIYTMQQDALRPQATNVSPTSADPSVLSVLLWLFMESNGLKHIYFMHARDVFNVLK